MFIRVVITYPWPTIDAGFAYLSLHEDVIKWKHFPRYWPFVRGIHRSQVNSPHKGQWRGALMFTLICVWKNGCVNNREAGDLRRYCAHYDVTVMCKTGLWTTIKEGNDNQNLKTPNTTFSYPDSKIHRDNMGPIWGQQDPCGPHAGPMNFAIWVAT